MATDSSTNSLGHRIPRLGQTSIRERVQEVLTELILDGTFGAGDQFPSEAELAKSFGVSRVVLREAMKALEARGLVEIIQGKGILVAEPRSFQASEALSLLLRRKMTTMVELWDARVVLETATADRACQRITPDQLETMRQALSRWSQPNIDIGTLVAEDERFHMVLVQASQNAVLALLMKTIADLLRESRKTTLTFGPGPDIAGHTAILNALEEKDRGAVRRTMLAHLQHAKDDLIAAGAVGWETASNDADAP